MIMEARHRTEQPRILLGRRVAIWARSASLAILMCFLAGAGEASSARRAIIFSWDGAANWVVDRLLAEGRLPNVARLAKMGVRAGGVIPAYPSKTAPGHAALWTGAYGDVNGITGNGLPLLPRANHTLLEAGTGFDGARLQAEPLGVSAARAGKRVVSLSMPFVGLPAARMAALLGGKAPGARIIEVGSFGSPIDGEKVWDGKELRPAEGWMPLPPHRGPPREFSFRVGDTPFDALVYDDPGDPVAGADTVLIRQGSKVAARAASTTTLKPIEAAGSGLHFSPRFRVRKGTLIGYAYFRLFSLTPDGRMALYQRAVSGVPGDQDPEEVRYLDAAGGAFGAPFALYEKGMLGQTLWQGSDGTAERRLLEGVRLDDEFLKRGMRYARKRWNPDLLFQYIYIPFTDEAGHTWVGALDPDSPRYDAALARKLWPYYAAVYQLQDEGLGDALAHRDAEAVVCVVSDHGMAGTSRMFSLNVVLEKAGLLARTADNKIDLARTKICAPPWSDYFLTVNGTDWKGGIVPPAERGAVLRAATEALLSTTDPANGRHVVTRLFRPGETVGLGIGGAAGGDLYFDVAPGYEPSNEWRPDALWTWPTAIGSGAHGFWSQREKMQAICFIGGASVAAGKRLSGIRQIDIAPTLARLLGIPVPGQAQGHVLGEVIR